MCPRRRLLALLPIGLALACAGAPRAGRTPVSPPATVEEGQPPPSTTEQHAPPEDQLLTAREGAAAAEAAQQWSEAARLRLVAAELAPEAERAQEGARALALVDTRLTAAEVVELAARVPEESPLRPAMLLRAAHARLQQDDVRGAEEAAREVTERHPDSAEAREASAFLAELARRAPLDPRVIGVAVPLSGKQKAWGEAILQGVALALGPASPFRLAVIDTVGMPEVASDAIAALVQREGAIAAIGGVTSAEAMETARAAQAQGLPFISLSRVEGVTAAGPFVFRNMLTAEAQAKALTELAMARRGLRRFALLYPQSSYGQELAHDFWDEAVSRGGEIRAAESYAPDQTTFGPLVKMMVGKAWLDERPEYKEGLEVIAAQELDPYRRRKAVERLRAQIPPLVDFDAVFIPDFAKNVALVAPALAVEDIVTSTCDPRELARIKKSTGRDDLNAVQLLGANGWDDPSLVERAGRYVECALFVDGFYAASGRPATKAFVGAFQARFERPPTILEATAFDAAGLISKVLSEGAATRDRVRAALLGTKDFPGATGDLSFDERGEVVKPLFHLTVDKGEVRELTPAELSPPGTN